MANWPNTIQCLGLDDTMSLGIKSFASQGVHDKVHDEVHDKVLDWYQDLWGNRSWVTGELLS